MGSALFFSNLLIVVVVPRTFLVRNAILNTTKTVNTCTNIAKGTRDPRVEFISQVLTQILIKFNFRILIKH